MTTSPVRRRAVVLRALGLGDLLTAVPALRALRGGLPDHEVILLAPSPFACLVHLAGIADAVVHLDGKDGFPTAVPPLGGVPIDVAVDLHGRGPASHRVLLDLEPTRLVAFDCPPVHRSPAAWCDDEHEVHRWTRLVAAEGFPADPTDLSVPTPLRRVGEAVEGSTVLHPGAASAARRWPVERWAELARGERAAGRRIVVTAGPREVTLAAEVAARAGLDDGAVVQPRDLLDLLAVVGRAQAVVAADTGVAHAATAVGTPSVVLFGPTSPDRWGPPRDRPQHRVLWAGQVGDPHAGRPDPGLLAISVGDVRAELAQLVGSERTGLGSAETCRSSVSLASSPAPW